MPHRDESFYLTKKILHEFGKNVRIRRSHLNLTKQALADKSGCHVNYIAGIERGQRNPSLLIIINIASALEITPGDLIPSRINLESIPLDEVSKHDKGVET